MRLAITAMAMAGVALAQAPARTPDGKPNFNGVWQTMTTANWNLLSHGTEAGRFPALGAIGAVPPGPGVVVGDKIPYLPAAAAQQQQNFKNRWTADPEVKCYLPGVPRATYMPFPFQIFQTTNTILIAYEYGSTIRTIHMNKHMEPPVDSWMGWSNGHWEGDTLVVEATGFNDQTWFDRAGNHHSNALKVTERYTPAGTNIINYEARIEDPKTFSAPWTIRLPIYRHVDPNVKLMEFRCVELTEELLYGDLTKK